MTNLAASELDYGITIAVQSLIEAMGMYAENQKRISNGESIAYDSDSFSQIIEKNGLYHNSVCTRWEGKQSGG